MVGLNSDRNRAFWLFFSALFVALFTYPLLQVFNRTTRIFGIPLLILYLLGGWILLIGVIYRFTSRLGTSAAKQDTPQDPERDRS